MAPELRTIFQLNEVLPVLPVLSWAVTVTLLVSPVVGVPEINPVAALIERPVGKPTAL